MMPRSDPGRSARRFALPRRYPAAAVHLLPSGFAGDAADCAGASHRLRPFREADRPRLPGLGTGDGAAHHPRQGAVAKAGCAVRDAGRGRARRAARRRVAAMIYLIFNEGYSASGDTAEIRKRAMRGGYPAGAAVASAPVPERAGDHGTDGADCCCSMRASAARFDASGEMILLDDQDRALWNSEAYRRRPRADRQGDAPSPAGPLSDAGRDRGAAMPVRPSAEETDWAQIDALYAALELMQPSPVVTLNRAVAAAKVRGPGGGACR